LILTPLGVCVHSAGAIWGLFRPIERFEVTERVDPTTPAESHEELSPEDLQNHDGRDRRLRDSDGAFEDVLFGDE
jgi:hypothetical protein